MRRLLSEITIAGFGAITTLFTVIVLFLVELVFGFSVYTFMVCFIAPIGAIGAGFVASSGYYVGAKLANRRPTTLMLLGMIGVSLATFFLVHYLGLVCFRVAAGPAYALVAFGDYLDTTIRETSLRFVGGPDSTGELGAWGYVFASIQVLGFMLGGVVVYATLVSQPYCQSCSRYLSKKGKQTRFTSDADSLKAIVRGLVSVPPSGDLQQGIDAHANHGTAHGSGYDRFRSSIEIRFCKKCGQHWLGFGVQKEARGAWRDVNELSLERFSDQELNVRAGDW